MPTLKTKPTPASVKIFLDAVADESRRADCYAVLDIMRKATRAEPVMWGPSIVGFGKCHMVYESGRELDWMLTGFSPRKSDLTLYIMSGFEGHADLMKKLGKYKTGKSCLYIKRLADVDAPTLRELVKRSVSYMKKTYPAK